MLNKALEYLDKMVKKGVDIDTRFWEILREEYLSAELLHEFACRCAEKALALVENPDPRSVAAIEAKRKWLRGEISTEELILKIHHTEMAGRNTAFVAAWPDARDSAYMTMGSLADEEAYRAISSEVLSVTYQEAVQASRFAQMQMLVMLIIERDVINHI